MLQKKAARERKTNAAQVETLGCASRHTHACRELRLMLHGVCLDTTCGMVRCLVSMHGAMHGSCSMHCSMHGGADCCCVCCVTTAAESAAVAAVHPQRMEGELHMQAQHSPHTPLVVLCQALLVGKVGAAGGAVEACFASGVAGATAAACCASAAARVRGGCVQLSCWSCHGGWMC